MFNNGLIYVRFSSLCVHAICLFQAHASSFKIVDVGRSSAYIFDGIRVLFETFDFETCEMLLFRLRLLKGSETSNFIELHSSWL